MVPVTTSTDSPSSAPDRLESRGAISWVPNHELDPHQWAVAGRRLGVVGRSIQWLLGDWLSYGNSRFGERYARASQITGYDPQTLMNMVYVASRFPISRRREQLSWSHHETLAALEAGEQDRWLDTAIEYHWSVSDLRTMLRTSRREAPLVADRDAAAGESATVMQGVASSGPSSDAKAGALAEVAALATVLECPRCGERISLTDHAD